jgi:hypothetical protein
MEILRVTEKVSGDFKGAQMTEEHYDRVISTDTMVLGPGDEVIAVLVKKALPMELVRASWAHLRDYHPKTENRGTASGVKMVARVRKDGKVSKTLRAPKGSEVESGVAGFLDRYPRIPFCRACSFNTERPKSYEELLPLFQKVAEVHQKYDPKGYEVSQSYQRRTNPAFTIPGTAYTTVTINKNFRTYAHLDANNLKDSTCAMALIREGNFTGGLVVFPEWRIAVQMDTADVVIFRNMKDFHGNTKIVGLSKDFQRCTLVHYFREKMVNCGTPAEELERAKRREAGDAIANDNLNEFEDSDAE